MIDVVRKDAIDAVMVIVQPDDLTFRVENVDVLILGAGDDLQVLVLINIGHREREQAIVETFAPFLCEAANWGRR